MPILLLWQIAAVLSGSSVGLLGVYLVGLRMPFLGVAVAHVAMAGAVFAYLIGWPAQALALPLALLAAAAVAWLASAHHRADLNTITGVLLSLTMGLTFLGIGLHTGDLSPLLSLMWGSILFVRPLDTLWMALLAVVLFALVGLLGRELEALLFSRGVARLSGIHERVVLTLFLVVAALVISINLQIVGGLLMYTLLVNPAAAAYAWARSMRAVRVLALGLGVASTLGGFWISVWFDLPTGACIALVSSGLYGFALLGGGRRTTPNPSRRRGPASP